MWSLIVVFGLVAVVLLVGVLVALGMRASRAGADDDWMSDDEQPHGRRGGRSRGRRGQGDEPEEEPYGDMRVAGTPLGAPQHAPQQLPAAPVAGRMSGSAHGPMAAPMTGPMTGPAPLPPQPPGPAPARSGRSSEEMDDEEYWSTITFDKPKFPWRQNTGQPVEPRGQDPLGPSRPGQVPAAPERSMPDMPAPPTTPQPAVSPNPLDTPARRANETDPGAIPAYGPAEQSGGFSPYGSEPASGFGDDPLNTGERPAYGSLPPVTVPIPPSAGPASGPTGSTGSTGSGRSTDDDGHRLPTVDELLAKIQSDRKRAAAESEPAQPSFDPNDPLNTGERRSYGSSSSSSYGSSSSTSPSSGSGWSSSDSYGSDPLSGGYSSSGGGGSYGSSSYDNGYTSSPGHSGDSSPYGSSSHQTDPLDGGYTGSSSDSSGSYGAKQDTSGGYPDYTGNTYNSSGSSYGESRYYGSSPQGQGYDSGSGSPPAPGTGQEPDEATQAYPSRPYGHSYGSGNDKNDKQRQDDWKSYGDHQP